MWLLKISLILVDSLLKVGSGKTKKILEKSLKSHGIFSQKRCMNPDIGTPYRGKCFLTRQIPTYCLPKSGGIVSEHWLTVHLVIYWFIISDKILYPLGGGGGYNENLK
jgi:hypothetical protein